MKRCQSTAFFNLCNNVIVNCNALEEIVSAMGNPVAYCINLKKTADNTHCWINKCIQHIFYGFSVVNDWFFKLIFIVSYLMCMACILAANALNKTFCQYFAAIRAHFKHLIFKRRTAAINYQYFHNELYLKQQN